MFWVWIGIVDGAIAVVGGGNEGGTDVIVMEEAWSSFSSFS